MVAGPEVSRLVSNYESKSGKKDESRNHHEETKSSQKVFFQKVGKLYAVIEEMGSPFEECTSDLLTIHSKDIADPSKAEMVIINLHTGGELKMSCKK